MNNQRKLIIVISIVGILFSGVLFSILYLNYSEQEKLIKESAIEYTENINALSMDKLEGILVNISQTPKDLKVILENTSLTDEELTTSLKLILEQNASIYGLCPAYEKYNFDSKIEYYEPYYYRDNDSLVFVNYDIEPENYFEKDWYKTPKDLKKAVWIEPYADSTAGLKVMTTYSLPFYNKDKSLRGILATDVFLRDFQNYLSDFKILETGSIFTFSSEKNILTHKDSSFIMKETMYSLSKKLNQPILEQIADSVKNNISGQINTDKIFDYGKSVVKFNRLSSGWGVVIIFPEDELYRDLVKLKEKNIIIAIAGILFILGFAIFFYFIFLKKITDNYKKDLEKKVNDRTLELREKNDELIAIEEELRQNNEELHTLNEDVLNQKEIIEKTSKELQYQSSRINEKNLELEKFNLQLKKYFTIIEQSPFAVLITDIKGNIEYTNPFFSKITGFNFEEIVGKSPRFLQSGKTSAETFQELWKTILSGKTWEGNIINSRKDKSIFIERAIITPINVNGQISNFVAIKEDVTEIRKAEQLILETLDTTQKQKVIIENAHKNITDSINYAKTIQNALLTNNNLIQSYIDEYFLIFKPKEVVSGDFYYVNKIGDNLIFVVSDCTGHGVPGGFMTILGITYLHDIIQRESNKNAAEILGMLRERIQKTFRTFGTENKSGMDIVLCMVNTKTNILQYAGAFNPLFIIRESQLIEYPATKNPIGFYPKEIEFKNNEIQLIEKDLIYLFSDGYQDQFGSKNIRKFTKNRLKNLLTEISVESLTMQKQILDENLKNWQGEIEQIDDITILGLKWQIKN